MGARSSEQLTSKKCAACSGDVEKYTPEQARAQLRLLRGWRLSHGGSRIRKDWRLKDFSAGIDFFVRVAQLAEQEGHHPDLHLEGYRQAWVEIWTHAIGGLSESDFILAAKVDQLQLVVTGTSPALD